jgi:aspartate/methionine/tyrosine aminotransferase
MTLPIFQLEEFLGEWEFKARYMLCGSDAESWSQAELLSMADSESLELWDNLKLSYTEVAGLPVLRQEIAQLYERCNAENILCFAGAEDGIYCAMEALLTPDDHVIVITPCYQSLAELPKHSGACVTSVELSEEQNWELDLARLEASIRDNTKMVVINYPHNPTGARLGTAKLLGLIEIARKYEIIVFSDEVYRLLGDDHSEWEPPVVSVYERGISLGVMSKAFGLPGLRIGWLAVRDQQVLKKIEYVKHYTSICNSAPAEILSLIALRSKDLILSRNNLIVQENIKLLDQFFHRQAEIFSWVRPRGGCIGFARYSGNDGVDSFCQQLVEHEGVLLLPGRVYNWPGDNFRIGFGRKNMPEALARLEYSLDGLRCTN